MSELDYLKTVNDAEAAVYETTKKLEKSRKEYKEAFDKVNEEKRQIYENLSKLKKKIDDNKKRLGYHKLILPNSLKLRMLITVILVLAFQTIVYLFTSVIFNNVTPSDAAIIFSIIMGIPIIILALFISAVEREGNYIFGLIISSVTILIFYGLSYFSYSLFSKLSISIEGTIIIFTFILCSLSAYIVYLYTKHKNNMEGKSIKKINGEITTAKNNYNVTKEFANKKIASLDNKLGLMQKDISQIENTLLKNKQYLKSLYDQGVIHQDYRDWNSVCIFIKYFEMGLCNSLKGTNGAYSIYRKEGFKTRTISSIGEISSKINSLTSTQSYMASQIAAINYKIDKFIINTYGL